MKTATILESKAIIRFSDCDPFNHLNNSSYINYFFNHRNDEVQAVHNIDVYDMAKKVGKSWVSSVNQIAYLNPAVTNEIVTIQSQLIQFSDTELLVEMRMYNEDKTQIKAVFWASLVYFNFVRKRRDKHDADLMQQFEEALTPIEATTFENRVAVLKKN
jgi:acyl-CoA thioester hydrolase